MTDILRYPTRPARSLPSLTEEPKFDTRLCDEIAGKDIPRRRAKHVPAETSQRPLFELRG